MTSAVGAPLRIASDLAAIAPSSLSIGTTTESFKSGQARIDVVGDGADRRGVADVNLAPAKLEAAFLVEPNREGIDAMLLGVDACGEGGFVVVLMHRHNRLHDYGAIIDALGDEEDGTSGETRAVIQRLLLRIEATKRRDHHGRKQAHETGADHQLDVVMMQRCDERAIESLARRKSAMFDND